MFGSIEKGRGRTKEREKRDGKERERDRSLPKGCVIERKSRRGVGRMECVCFQFYFVLSFGKPIPAQNI
jgi:hypothetical protein